jgi:hypothetical protein
MRWRGSDDTCAGDTRQPQAIGTPFASTCQNATHLDSDTPRRDKNRVHARHEVCSIAAGSSRNSAAIRSTMSLDFGLTVLAAARRRPLPARRRRPGGIRSLYVGSLETGVSALLLTGFSNTFSVGLAYSQGFLLYTRGGPLFAQPFDLDSRTLRGTARLIADNVAEFSVADTGALVYGEAPPEDSSAAPRRLSWFDRRGQRLVSS